MVLADKMLVGEVLLQVLADALLELLLEPLVLQQALGQPDVLPGDLELAALLVDLKVGPFGGGGREAGPLLAAFLLVLVLEAEAALDVEQAVQQDVVLVVDAVGLVAPLEGLRAPLEGGHAASPHPGLLQPVADRSPALLLVDLLEPGHVAQVGLAGVPLLEADAGRDLHYYYWGKSSHRDEACQRRSREKGGRSLRGRIGRPLRRRGPKLLSPRGRAESSGGLWDWSCRLSILRSGAGRCTAGGGNSNIRRVRKVGVPGHSSSSSGRDLRSRSRELRSE
jgi:hypothetical protein